jgi:hypothetical protein
LHSMPHQLLLAYAHTAIAATAASTHTAVLFLLLLQGPHHLLQIYCHLQLLLLAYLDLACVPLCERTAWKISLSADLICREESTSGRTRC